MSSLRVAGPLGLDLMQVFWLTGEKFQPRGGAPRGRGLCRPLWALFLSTYHHHLLVWLQCEDIIHSLITRWPSLSPQVLGATHLCWGDRAPWFPPGGRCHLSMDTGHYQTHLGLWSKERWWRFFRRKTTWISGQNNTATFCASLAASSTPWGASCQGDSESTILAIIPPVAP